MFKQSQIQSNDQLPDKFKELLLEHNPNIKTESFENLGLSKNQEKAFDLFKKGKSIAIVSSAGCGKSFLLKTIENYTKINTNKKIAVCATTGIAAYNINGLTIHSFMGIGSGENDVDFLIRRIYRKKPIRDKIIDVDIIILDEVSMLSAELFEKLNIICQRIRKNKIFFGGIQLVLSFDPLQLLPVFNKNPEIYKDIDERLIIESPVFNANFIKNQNIILLTENFRQSDPIFLNLLLRIRNGTYTNDDINILNKRKIKKSTEDMSYSKSIHLVSSNKEAQSINQTNIKNLKGDTIQSTTHYDSNNPNSELSDLLIRELQFQFKQKGIESLVLTIGARVMLIKNIEVSLGLVNGAIGTIKKIVNGQIEVGFDNGVVYPITTVVWDLEVDDIKVSASQIPLMLAYALTCHKAQSLTLDSAILDLGNCFADHQVYVALSRLRTLDGLYLKSFNPIKIKVNQKMKQFVDSLI